MSVTVNAPGSFATTQSSTGFDYVFAQQELLEAMADRLDPSALGIIGLLGDVGGSGSDVIRVTHIDDVGFARRMTALTAENGTVDASPYTLGYTEATIGQYGLAHETTWLGQVLGRPGANVDLDSLIAKVPDSYWATVRYLACVTGATFTDSVGSTSADLDVDTWIALVAYFEERLGSAAPKTVLKPQQLSQLRASMRSEPAFASSASDFAAVQRLNGMQTFANFAGMGVDVALTDDVQTSGGAYQGFATSPGGIGLVRASTAPIKVANPAGAIYIPQLGIIIVQPDEGKTRTSRYEATAYVGLAKASSDVVAQVRVLSNV